MTRKKIMIFTSCFSNGLDELTRKQQRSDFHVLVTLHRIGRFSVFEATENGTIARKMTDLVRRKLIEIDNSPGFPWSIATLTPSGMEILKHGVDEVEPLKLPGDAI